MRRFLHVLKLACVALLLLGPRQQSAQIQVAVDRDADLRRIKHFHTRLQLVQAGKETWRAVSSQLYHGSTSKQRSFNQRADAIYQLLGSLGGLRQSTLGLCSKVTWSYNSI
jgi:hypothetical protein